MKATTIEPDGRRRRMLRIYFLLKESIREGALVRERLAG